MKKSGTNEPVYAGLFRRLFAISYDCILLVAILFIVSAFATAINNGKAVEPGTALYPILLSVNIGLIYLYFAWFWIHDGQTLGMKTWRMQLRVDSTACNPAIHIGWKLSALRFLVAIISWGFMGMGLLWALFDKKNRCWHDLVSKTVLIDIRKP